MDPSAFLAVFLATTLSWGILRGLVPRFRRCLLDQPNQRSSHNQPKPRGGGIAFVFISSVASALCLLTGSSSTFVALPLVAAPLLALPLALVGFLDDCHNLPATSRYAVQFLTAIVVILMSPLVAPSFAVFPLLALLVIAVTAVINFTNFMDGMDGLVAGCLATAIAAASIKLAAPWPTWALLGALLGFLLWNWSPAKVFMGDVGSTFLGAVFSMLVLQSSTCSEAFALLMVATPLFGDAFLCVLRRLIAGHPVSQAHRLHLFQRLYQAGWTHACVSSLYIAATAFLAIALLFGGLPWVISLAAIELLIGIWLDQQVAVPFAVASRN
jgi:Fuc2NAc and GlcNAc transferase